MKAILAATMLCLGSSLAAQAQKPPEQPTAPAPAGIPAPPKAEGAVAAKGKPRVQIVTTYGPFVVELEPELAPRTVANFLRYVSEGFYSDTIFHRVIEGFMVQGGGLKADLTEKTTHEPVPNEAGATAKAGLLNLRGTIAMARQDMPQSATAQFYINTVNNPALDHKNETDSGFGYCAFGRVVSGMEVVDKIEKVRTGWRHGMQNVPDLALRIKSAQRLPDVP